MQAFDMQRDMMITPKRLEFARTKEQELSDNLMRLASEKQEEIKNLVAEAIKAARTSIIRTVIQYEFIGMLASSFLWNNIMKKEWRVVRSYGLELFHL
mgnify:FL=1